jgi:hypothetical protein
MGIMDLSARKIDLISWISNLRDEKILSRIETIKKEEPDWWDTISDEEKAEIEEGLAQLDRGETIPHEQVMAKYKKWL